MKKNSPFLPPVTEQYYALPFFLVIKNRLNFKSVIALEAVE